MVFFREECLKARAIPENIIELQFQMLLEKEDYLDLKNNLM